MDEPCKNLAQNGKSPALDLLRVLATAMVLAVHTGQTAGTSPYTDFGAWGVQLFFILSGYLACASLARNPSATRYYRGRIARILPLYWLVVAVRYLVDFITYAAKMPIADVLAGPCGPRYLRYFFFLQMFLPSDDWALWNNRNVLWTMSAFALFYLLAPLLHRLLGSFFRSFAALLFCLACKGFLSSGIENHMAQAGYPQSANASLFATWNPLAVLYCFLFGWALYYALHEGRALLYGVFCLLVPIAFSFQRCAQECLFTVLLLLALVLPCGAWLNAAVRPLRFLSGASFFLYLAHPLLLDLFPRYSGDNVLLGAGYFVLVFAAVTAGCLLLYRLCICRFEQWAAQRILGILDKENSTATV